MNKIFLLGGGIFLSFSVMAGIITTDPKTDKEKKDSANASKENALKGFKNLFVADFYNPTEPYKLQINPKAVPYIDDYIAKHRNHLESMQIWGRPYFRLIDNILTGYGLPKELKYLAVIESNLENAAISWAGARGPWQLMPETARQLGLVVTQYRDDRTDYYKSTHAAAKYLKMLYDQLGGDWLLVIAGYNGGPGRVLNAIKKRGNRNFWEIQNSLPLESRNHVKKFIGTHYVMEGTGGLTTVTAGELADLHAEAVAQTALNPAGAGSDLAQVRSKLPEAFTAGAKILKIQGKYNSVVLSNYISMDVAAFNALNPQFDKMVSEENGYELLLPVDKMEQFTSHRYVILQQSIMALLSSLNNNSDGYPVAKPKPVAKSKK